VSTEGPSRRQPAALRPSVSHPWAISHPGQTRAGNGLILARDGRELRALVLVQPGDKLRARCVGCGAGPFYADQGPWVWQVHHVVPRQVLRRHGRPEMIMDPRGCVILCRRCHERHERPGIGALTSWRVPRARLPSRALRHAEELGNWAVRALERMHPTKEGSS
jgi:hypothetical protein